MNAFDLSKCKPGDVLAIRSPGWYGKAIRGCLGSYTNHTAMLVRDTAATMATVESHWYVGEAIPPKSTLTSLAEYSARMIDGRTIIRVWRVPGVSDGVRQAVSDTFMATKLGVKYPMSVARLWVFRMVNSLPWTIEGEWCTPLVWNAWHEHYDSAFAHPLGYAKKNPTPRTNENRLVAGVLEDVTAECIPKVSARD